MQVNKHTNRQTDR